MTQQNNVLMQCRHSFAPGGDWYAWVEFRITKYGFSVWVGGEDGCNGKVRMRVAAIKQPYSWREAARQLLNLNEGSLYGDFRSDIDEFGECSFSTDILKLCWMQDDDISIEAKKFLVELKDHSLELLENSAGSLISDEVLSLITRYLEVSSGDPFERWALNFPTVSEFSFKNLVTHLETNADEEAARQPPHSLKPYCIKPRF